WATSAARARLRSHADPSGKFRTHSPAPALHSPPAPASAHRYTRADWSQSAQDVEARRPSWLQHSTLGVDAASRTPLRAQLDSPPHVVARHGPPRFRAALHRIHGRLDVGPHPS